MTRRCSHCSNNGHNSRTCPSRGGGGAGGGGGGGGGGVRLFGVRLTDGSIIKKSASMGNLSAICQSSLSPAAGSPNHDSPGSSEHQPDHVPDGYLSDDTVHASNRRAERKKGVPWTEDEHRKFLIGLQKLGKGDWRGIARKFVVSRTPTQVASHAQKFFIRQNNASRRKRRSSLFDMAPEMGVDTPVQEEQVSGPSQTRETDNGNSQPSLDLSLKPDFEPMEAVCHEPVKDQNQAESSSSGFFPVVPGFYPTYMPISFPVWPPNMAPTNVEMGGEISHQVLKPVPVVPKEPVNVDELVGMSHLSLREGDRVSYREPSPLSLKLIGEPPSRQSAFHANPPASRAEISKGKNDAIQAI